MLPDFHQNFRRHDGYEIVGKEGGNFIVRKGVGEPKVVPRIWIVEPILVF
jgi:hypothetical protein